MTENFILYNTASRKKEVFKPVSGNNVRMYVCGITPYDYAHLGHARCYVVFDLLNRYLRYLGYNVKYVQNVTDIDDKILEKSRQTGESPLEISEKYFNDFKGNMKALNVMPADLYPAVSQNIDGIIKFIEKLIETGSAYESAGSVYFKTGSFKEYGQLSGRNVRDMLSGQEDHSGEKKDETDFALWKKDRDYGWESPWGIGRPGWHIECSAISREFLGDRIDIHGGGLDLIFPHHENEVAQSKALTGEDPVKYWVHNGMVNLKGDKMAKSTGNFFLLRDLLKKYDPMIVRMYLLSTGYRQVLNFDANELKDTRKAFNKLAEFKKEVSQLAGKNKDLKSFKASVPGPVSEVLNNDLNSSAAIGEIFKLVNSLTGKFFKNSFKEEDIKIGLDTVFTVENILGINLTADYNIDSERIEALIERRRQLREEKKYGEADKIRDELLEEGVHIKDTPAGTKWFKK